MRRPVCKSTVTRWLSASLASAFISLYELWHAGLFALALTIVVVDALARMVERFVLSPAGQPVSYGIGSWAASVRAWACQITSPWRGHGRGDRRRRAFVLYAPAPTGDLLPGFYRRTASNVLQPEPGRWRQPRVFSAPRCSALEGV